MSSRNPSKLVLSCTALVTLVIASAASTARADQPGARFIPAAERKSDSTATERASELPLPYSMWRGGPLPPPLARPRELPRRPLELTAAMAAFLPSCSPGTFDDRGCATIHPGVGLDTALLYRVGPFFGFGAEGVLSGFTGRGAGALSSAGGAARYLGVVGRLYFADAGPWDPYASLSIGYGSLDLKGAGERGATSGLGGRISGGVDYMFGSHFRLGPTAGFAHWLAWSENRCNGSICRDQRLAYGRLLGFATLGLRLTASFGDAL